MNFKDLEIYERIYSSHWFLTSYNGIGFVRDMFSTTGREFFSEIIYVMENEMCRYIFHRQEFEKAAHFTATRLINDTKWRNNIYKKINYYTKLYFKEGEKLRTTNLSVLSNTQIISIVRRVIRLQHYHQVYSVLANGVVLDGRNHFSDKIRKELQIILKNPRNFDDFWSQLTQLTQMSLRQKKDFAVAQLAENCRKKFVNKKLLAINLKTINEKYCWLDYNNLGPALSFERLEKEFQQELKFPKNIFLKIELSKLKRQQKILIKQLKFNNRSKFLINLAKGVIFQKGFRKDVQYHGFYCYEYLLKELARRKKIKDWKNLFFLFPWEVEGFILDKEPVLEELKQRRKLSCFIVKKKITEVLVGPKAQKLVNQLNLKEDFSKLIEAKGQCAYAGVVKGRVKIIQTPADIAKMKKGDILLSQATSPDLLPAMKKAGAIVTNTGGLICHAAIISRELKIPCVVGTARATLIFKDGDIVEVDATKGIIRKIK